jgi:AmmeMemoRadiSam system protein B|tara:strand:+ start:22510 stop:23307 length:798 start_codon:yes stop_codon:yes gene_type:complete
MIKNKMNFSGTFYPDDKKRLLKYFEIFTLNEEKINLDISPRAIIVPHAGYIYSGSVANMAYNLSKEKKPKRVIVIGPSHRYYLKGASLSIFDSYETPLGDLHIDKEFCLKLIEKYDFLDFDKNAHMEHSTETQMPFIKNYFNSEVLEIVYGKIDAKDLSLLITELLKDKDNFLVISTDLSHFYTLTEANILDEICIEAIKNQDLDKLTKSCEACGKEGVKALLIAAKEFDYKVKFLDYKTSFDVTKDKSKVVGYASFVIGKSIVI